MEQLTSISNNSKFIEKLYISVSTLIDQQILLTTNEYIEQNRIPYNSISYFLL